VCEGLGFRVLAWWGFEVSGFRDVGLAGQWAKIGLRVYVRDWGLGLAGVESRCIRSRLKVQFGFWGRGVLWGRYETWFARVLDKSNEKTLKTQTQFSYVQHIGIPWPFRGHHGHSVATKAIQNLFRVFRVRG